MGGMDTRPKFYLSKVWKTYFFGVSFRMVPGPLSTT